MLWILWTHVVCPPVFVLTRGESLGIAIECVVPIALGFLAASAVLVHAWDGQNEAYFHLFVIVIVAMLVLYEDWLGWGWRLSTW
jgi:hypothetical protein